MEPMSSGNDVSVEGCNASIFGDFVFVGQVIGAKILNNIVVVNPSVGNHGMIADSFYPFANLEIAGNTYTEGPNSTIVQLADGQRDLDLHDNTFSSPYGPAPLNVSQGVINTHIHRNNFYHILPAGYSVWSGTIQFSTSYQTKIDDNIIFTDNRNASVNLSVISLGLSNGNCVNCTVSNNTIYYSRTQCRRRNSGFRFDSGYIW